MHFSWRIQDPARTPERKKNVNQLRFVRSCPFPSNLTKLSFVRSPRCVVPSRKAAATARIGEVWYYIKLCGATRGFARRKLSGWGCSVKEIESFFPPVLVLVSATEHRSFDFGETVMRDETRSGEGRGGKGGKDSERSFRGKMWKGEERKVGGEDSSVSNENIVSISRSRRVERFFLFETYAEARIETSRGNIFARTKRIPISIASRFEQYFEF